MDSILWWTPVVLLPLLFLYRYLGCLEPSAPIQGVDLDAMPTFEKAELKENASAPDDLREPSCASSGELAVFRVLFTAIFPSQGNDAFEVFLDLRKEGTASWQSFQHPDSQPESGFLDPNTSADRRRFRAFLCMAEGTYEARCRVNRSSDSGQIFTGLCAATQLDAASPKAPDKSYSRLRFAAGAGDTALTAVHCFE